MQHLFVSLELCKLHLYCKIKWCQIDPHYELIPIYHFQFCTILVTEMSQNSGGAPAAGFSMFNIVMQFCHTFSIKIPLCELSEFKKQH